MVTSRDIAEKAGVSRATVSAVLNGRDKEYSISPVTAEKVRAIAKELGYKVTFHARSLRTGRSQCIGWVSLRQTPAGELLHGALAEAAENRGVFLTCPPPVHSCGQLAEEDAAYVPLVDALTALRAGVCDHLVIDGDHDNRVVELVDQHAADLAPRIVWINAGRAAGKAVLRIDYRRAFTHACACLAGHGITQVLVCCLPESLRRLTCGGEPAELAALAKREGLACRVRLLDLDDDPYAAIEDEALPAKGQALLIEDSMRAMCIIDGLSARGLSPQTLPMLALGDELSPYCDPPLATLDERPERIAERLLALIDDPQLSAGQQKTVHATFTERGSCVEPQS